MTAFLLISCIVFFLWFARLKIIQINYDVDLEMLTHAPSLILGYDEPTEEMQLAAIKRRPWAAHYIKNPTLHVQYLLIYRDYDNIIHINKHSN